MEEIVKTISEYPIASGVFGLFIIIIADIVKATILQAIIIIEGARTERMKGQPEADQTETETEVARHA